MYKSEELSEMTFETVSKLRNAHARLLADAFSEGHLEAAQGYVPWFKQLTAEYAARNVANEAAIDLRLARAEYSVPVDPADETQCDSCQ